MKMNFGSKTNDVGTRAQQPVSNNAGQAAPKVSGLKIPGKTSQPMLIMPEGESPLAKLAESSKPVDAGKEKQAVAPTVVPQPATQTTGLTYPGQSISVPDKVMAEFVDSKRILAETLTENKEMIGYALRRVMIDLRTHPELSAWMLPEDYGAMIRALRTSYNNTVFIKEKKQRKKKKDSPGAPEGFSLDDLRGMLDKDV